MYTYTIFLRMGEIFEEYFQPLDFSLSCTRYNFIPEKYVSYDLRKIKLLYSFIDYSNIIAYEL